jgi:hypothetical protein
LLARHDEDQVATRRVHDPQALVNDGISLDNSRVD